ncbi:MMPL family transporter, partial [Thermodesulfobacteriota bacterium]
GLVLIVSIATVIHIVTHFNRGFVVYGNRIEAVRQALFSVGEPCFMCALTTSVGFATIMVSPLPMIRQLGLIMSLGVLVSFVLSISRQFRHCQTYQGTSHIGGIP